MAITISGDTPNFTAATITTLTSTTGTVTTLNAPTGVLATQNGMTGIAKAWVNFNGTGTVAIRSSFNVSSITDNGTGDYTVNFTTAMPNADYSVSSSCGGYIDGNAPTNLQVFNDTAKAPTTTTLRLFAVDTNTTNYRDIKLAYVTIFSS
jgi:hypothetical protein